MINLTTINLFLAQSKFFKLLDSTQLREQYLEASIKDGLQISKQCPIETLVGCNDNQEKIINCIKKGPAKFVECQEKNCPDCACAHGFLLGYDCNSGSMIRIIRNTSLPMTSFRNFFSSPHEEGRSAKAEEYLYVNYKGGISFGKTTDTLKQNLIEHRAFWTNTNGRIRSKRQEPVSTAETVMAVGNELAKTIKETVLTKIATLDKELQKVKEAAIKLSDKAKEQISEALTTLYNAETRVTETRSILESLAGETVDRVNKMEYYLNLVKDDWDQNKTAKFLGFQAKKMAELTDRSLSLLRNAHNEYTNITLELSTIKGKLESIVLEIDTLKNKNSEEYKNHKNNIRKEVYLPCCLNPVGWLACPICAGLLETKLKQWEKNMEDLNNKLTENKQRILDTSNHVDDFIEKLQGECKLIAKWQGKLIEVSEIDFKFSNSELFGFAATKSEVVKTLDGLKTAAQNYLDQKSGSK